MKSISLQGLNMHWKRTHILLRGGKVTDQQSQLVIHKFKSVQFILFNFVGNPFLLNCGMFQSLYEGTPAWLPLLLDIVLLPQPSSNDVTQESVRVLVRFQFCMVKPQHQSKFEDFSFTKLIKVLCDVYEIFLSCREEMKFTYTTCSGLQSCHH